MTMSLGDDVMEGSDSESFCLDYPVSNQSGDVLSLEDVAWADSCLVKDSEISYNNWATLVDTLLEIRASQPNSHDFSASGGEGILDGINIEILPSSDEAQTSPILKRTVDDAVEIGTVDDAGPSNEEFEPDSDDLVILKMIDKLKSKNKLGYPFLPNYSEDLKENENNDSGLDLGFPVMEPSNGDIFRVWDLDIPDEEDELFKQLNKALAESSLQPLPSVNDDSGTSIDLKKESLDDLIAGISELSLYPNSG